MSAETALYQAYENARARRHPGQRAGDAAALQRRQRRRARPRDASSRPGTTLGRLEIPRLGVSAVVRAGSDARTLRLAVGHIPGTALPGERGNVGLAAHRDTFFRRLGDIRADDEVRLVTPDGTFTYRVQARGSWSRTMCGCSIRPAAPR